MSKFNFVGFRDDKQDVFCIDGTDVSSMQWNSLGECVTVADPRTNKPYTFTVYSIKREFGDDLIFACGEFLNGREAFFIKE
jgi:hypothetical protein